MGYSETSFRAKIASSTKRAVGAPPNLDLAAGRVRFCFLFQNRFYSRFSFLAKSTKGKMEQGQQQGILKKFRLYDQGVYELTKSVPNTVCSTLIRAVKKVSKETNVKPLKILKITLKASKMKHNPFIPTSGKGDPRYPEGTNFLLNELLMRCNIVAMGSVYTADIADGRIYAPSPAEILTFMMTNGRTSHFGSRLPKDIGFLNPFGFKYGLSEKEFDKKISRIELFIKKGPLAKRNFLKTMKSAEKEESQLLDALEEYVPVKIERSRSHGNKGKGKYNSTNERLYDSTPKKHFKVLDEEDDIGRLNELSDEYIPGTGRKKCDNIYPDMDIELKGVVIPMRPPQTCWFSLEVVPKKFLKTTSDEELEHIKTKIDHNYVPPVERPTLVIAIRGSRMWYDWAIDGIVDTVPFPPNDDIDKPIRLGNSKASSRKDFIVDKNTEKLFMAHKGMANSALNMTNMLMPIIAQYYNGKCDKKLKVGDISKEKEENKQGNTNNIVDSMGNEVDLAEESHEKDDCKCNWDVIITGHSYGAGVAVLIPPLLKPRFPGLNIHAYGYATPACTSIGLSEAIRDYVTTIVFETDIVPRLGVYPISLMLESYNNYKISCKNGMNKVSISQKHKIDASISDLDKRSESSENKFLDNNLGGTNTGGGKKRIKSMDILDKSSLVPGGKLLLFRFSQDKRGYVHSFPEYTKKSKDSKPIDVKKFVYNPQHDYGLSLIDATDDLCRLECIPHAYGAINHDLSNYLRGFENIRISTERKGRK